jgi:hypothetical protein
MNQQNLTVQALPAFWNENALWLGRIDVNIDGLTCRADLRKPGCSV